MAPLTERVKPRIRLVVRRWDCDQLTASNRVGWLGATMENIGNMRLRSNNARRREGRRQSFKIPATDH